MRTLQAELNRLYLCDEPDSPGPGAQAPGLLTCDGRVRALVLELARPADWTVLSALWRGVQTELELPAPAIAVSGIDAYQLWFSLAQPVPVAVAQAFLESLRGRYLPTVAPGRIGMLPAADAGASEKVRHARLVPALQPETGLWSAFLAPDLAAIFSGEPWLDLPPSPDAQASILSRLECTKPTLFQAALEKIQAVGQAAALPPACGTGACDGTHDSPETSTPAAPGEHLDPKRFLLSVMADPAVALALRIEAAKALLPYCESRSGTPPPTP